jgi:hypothetical protein
MKRALALVAIFLVLFAVLLPGPAWAGGWHHGHRGGHGGGWWWPGALIGGLALGAVALVTAPLWAFAPPPPPVVQAPPPAVYVQPQLVYAAAPAYPVPPPNSAPPSYTPPSYSAPAASYQQAPPAPAVQREVVYDNGRYVLYGDGVRQPWQWVWVPATAPPPPPPPPR